MYPTLPVCDLDIMYWRVLVEPDMPIGSNVNFMSYIYKGPPVGTAGECGPVYLVFPKVFNTKAVIDGAITGTLIVQLYANLSSTSYYVRLTDVNIRIWKMDTATYTKTDIVPSTSIWSGSEQFAAGGASPTKNIGFYYSFDAESAIDHDEYIGMTIILSGFKSIDNSSLAFNILCDKSASDLTLSIPFVEDP